MLLQKRILQLLTWNALYGCTCSINVGYDGYVEQACLPLIDDLSNPAMRTRHWKQLVRVTGGALTIDNDMLKRMTLGELLSLGLQSKACRQFILMTAFRCGEA